MIKKILLGCCLFVSALGFSQESNSSPYSYYGIGDVKFKGTAEMRSMGGISAIPDSIHINLFNPASYSGLKLTTFTVGASNTNTKFKTATASEQAGRTSVDYIALAMPFKKLGFAFGLMPYSAVGYNIRNTKRGADDILRETDFHGKGGLNRTFAGVSYKINSKLTVGADFQYYFGRIETRSLVRLPEVVLQFPAREVNKSDYNGGSVNFGAMYQSKFGKYDWFASGTFSPQASLKGSTERQTASVLVNGSGQEYMVDEINQRIDGQHVKLPSRISFGTGIGMARKWFAGAEYVFQSSNELGNRFDNVTEAGFDSSHRVSLGGYFIPNYMSFSNYFSRVTYRAGLKYEKTGLVINNQGINDYGFSFGLGLPLGGLIGGSNLNLGMEMGRRGTTKSNLVQENYITLVAGLSLNDRWFVKRRYE